MKNRKLITVTGGRGFIGSRFVKYILENTKYDVAVIDILTYVSSNLIKQRFDWLDSSMKKRVKFYDGVDISDPKINSKTNNCLLKSEYVVNFAAETHVDNSITDGSPFMRTNVMGVFNLLEIARQSKELKRFVQISTDEVYGDRHEECIQVSDEHTLQKPSSYYAASKASADNLVVACGRTYGLKYLITRSCNNFGPHQYPEKFIPKILKCIKEDQPIPVYGDGTQCREWIYVDDNARMIFSLMKNSEAKNHIVNIGSKQDPIGNCDIVNYVSSVWEMLGKKVKIKRVKDRLGHDKLYMMDSTKLGVLEGKDAYWTLELFEFLHDQLLGLHDELN
jgi:dTDP-glucose 4,6-dehydratase